MSRLQLHLELAGSGLLALQRLVLEQQNHINRISNLSDILTQAYLTFEENHARLYVEHHALCECLKKAGIVTRTQLREHVSSYLRARDFASLLDQRRATQMISHFTGRSISCLALASTYCMEAVVGEGKQSRSSGVKGLHFPARTEKGSKKGEKSVSPALESILRSHRIVEALRRASGSSTVCQLLLASRCGLRSSKWLERRLKRQPWGSSSSSSSRALGALRGEGSSSSRTPAALLGECSGSSRTPAALRGECSSRTLEALRSEGIEGALDALRGEAAAENHPSVLHGSLEPAKEKPWRYRSNASLIQSLHGFGSLTELQRMIRRSAGCKPEDNSQLKRAILKSGPPVAAPHSSSLSQSSSHEGSGCSALLQEMWMYSVLAETLSVVMGCQAVCEFRKVSRSGNECMRAVYSRLTGAPRKPSPDTFRTPRCDFLALLQDLWQYSVIADTLSLTMDLDMVQRFRALSRAGNECMRGARTRMLQPLPADAPQERAAGADAKSGAAAGEDSEVEQKLRRGQLVNIFGLKSRPDLNGAAGRLLHYGKFSGRWSLNLTSGECVRIRPENLQVSKVGRSILQRIVEDDGTQVVIQRIASFTRQPGVSMLRVCGQAFMHLRSCGGRAGKSKIYVVGGHDGLRVLAAAEAFDPLVGEWEILPPMSVARVDPCVAVLKGRIYACGGVDGNTLKPVRRMFHFTKLPVRCHAQKSAECFDPRSNTWQSLPPMFEGRYAATSAVFRGRLFICGGRNEFGVTKTMECFDPDACRWEIQPCMKHPRFCMCSENTNGRLYVCGGCTLPTYQPRLPLDFKVQDDQRLVVEPTATAEYFDHSQERWVQLMPMTYGARYNAATACLGGHMYVLGGIFVPDMDSPPASIGTVRSFVERLTPNGWQRLPRMQRARAGAAAVADPVQEKLIVCGGHNGVQALCCVECYDVQKGAWEMMQPMSVKRTAASATIVSRGIYVCGGRDESQSLDFCERLDLQTGLWIRIPRMHQARFQVVAVEMGTP